MTSLPWILVPNTIFLVYRFTGEGEDFCNWHLNLSFDKEVNAISEYRPQPIFYHPVQPAAEAQDPITDFRKDIYFKLGSYLSPEGRCSKDSCR